jgi:hypothetical protein
MTTSNLLAVEALLRNCHELATDAREQAAEGKDSVLQRRLGALAKLINDELADVRTRLNAQYRRAG